VTYKEIDPDGARSFSARDALSLDKTFSTFRECHTTQQWL
jgi:hypothetical protein